MQRTRRNFTRSSNQAFLGTVATTEWTGTFVVHRFDELLFADDDAAANLACSDHRPIAVPLRLPAADDDQ